MAANIDDDDGELIAKAKPGRNKKDPSKAFADYEDKLLDKATRLSPDTVAKIEGLQKGFDANTTTHEAALEYAEKLYNQEPDWIDVDATSREIAPGVFLHRLSDQDPEGTIGLKEDGSLGIRKDVEVGGKTIRASPWVSDCVIFITEERVSSKTTEFTIKGVGAKDQRQVQLTVKAEDLAKNGYFKGQLIRVFGAKNRFGQMNWEFLQQITNKIGNVKIVQQIEVPGWVDGKLVAPGLVDSDNDTSVDFRFENKVAIDFRDVGEVDAGVKALRSLLEAFDPGNMAILMDTIFGAPVIADLWPDERYALLITGLTGTKKTTVTMLLMSIYGQRFNSESTLVRWGDGSTNNAFEYLASKVGPYPSQLDNFKIYSDKDIGRFQAAIHVLLEGGSKDRMERDRNGLRPGDDYLCTPVINGENYPGNDPATRARLVQLEWTGPIDIDKLTEAQKHVADLNAVGKAWCLWLGSDEGRETLNKRIRPWFNSTRDLYLKTTLRDAINAGRISTNAAIIDLIWDLLKAWPVMADLANDYGEALRGAIEDHIVQSQNDVIEDLDAEKFISWLKSELEVGRYMFSSCPTAVRYRDHYTESIGVYRFNKEVIPHKAEALITSEVFTSMLLPTWQKSVSGVRADKRSLLKQLVKRGYLSYNEKDKQFTTQRWIEKKPKRVLVFDWELTTGLSDIPVGDLTGEPVRENQEA